MILIVPLILFLILSVMLIVLMVQTHPPTAQDSVEALCDAIIRRDTLTSNSLISMEKLPEDVIVEINKCRGQHDEIATSWHPQVIKTYDDDTSTYKVVRVQTDESVVVQFTCSFIVNQWSIKSCEVTSNKSSI